MKSSIVLNGLLLRVVIEVKIRGMPSVTLVKDGRLYATPARLWRDVFNYIVELFFDFNLILFITTDTELNAIAALAIIGDRRIPKNG